MMNKGGVETWVRVGAIRRQTVGKQKWTTTGSANQSAVMVGAHSGTA